MLPQRASTIRILRRVLATGLALVLTLPGLCRAESEVGSEYQTKAAQIYSFTKFVFWPAKKFLAADSPLVIGVYGADEITDFLRESFQSRRVQGRPVEIRHLTNKAELVGCHLVFVSRSERDRLGSVLSQMRHENILSVGETDNFLRSGGVINFLNVEGAVRFQINLDAAGRERLKVSSKLLPISYPTGGAPRP